MKKRYKHGVLLGKFLMPHKGHKLTIEYGASLCDLMHVIISSKKTDKIHANIRYFILRGEVATSNNRVYFDIVKDLSPSTLFDELGTALNEDHWNYWIAEIKRLAPKADAIFTNDVYGERLAKELGIDWVPIDIERNLVTVSSTSITREPERYWWDMLEGTRWALSKRI
ncbi:MAG: HTH-type transcriptional repressor of NAD biosynthesis genes, partial [Bacteroidia bacterium]